jgi:hypothetical protein
VFISGKVLLFQISAIPAVLAIFLIGYARRIIDERP